MKFKSKVLMLVIVLAVLLSLLFLFNIFKKDDTYIVKDIDEDSKYYQLTNEKDIKHIDSFVSILKDKITLDEKLYGSTIFLHVKKNNKLNLYYVTNGFAQKISYDSNNNIIENQYYKISSEDYHDLKNYLSELPNKNFFDEDYYQKNYR